MCRLEQVCSKSLPSPATLNPDVWEVPREELVLLKELGAGMFGQVWKGLISRLLVPILGYFRRASKLSF